MTTNYLDAVQEFCATHSERLDVALEVLADNNSLEKRALELSLQHDVYYED